MNPMEALLLDPDVLMTERGEGIIGKRTLVFRETVSTNDLLLQMGEGGEPEGTAVFALAQSGGRGQRGNKWLSAPGLGLWFSILLRPVFHPNLSRELTAFAALAVQGMGVDAYGLDVRIKAPNDIYVGSRKIAGILTETRTGHAPFAVIGIGFNVNHQRQDFPPALRESSTSLRSEVGKYLTLQQTAINILQSLNARYACLAADRDAIIRDYETQTARFSSLKEEV